MYWPPGHQAPAGGPLSQSYRRSVSRSPKCPAGSVSNRRACLWETWPHSPFPQQADLHRVTPPCPIDTVPVIRKNPIRAREGQPVMFRNVRSLVNPCRTPLGPLAVVRCLRTLSLVAVDSLRLVALAARPRAALVAGNLFLPTSWLCSRSGRVRPRRAERFPPVG